MAKKTKRAAGTRPAAARTRPSAISDVPSGEDGRRERRERAKEARDALRRRQARARLLRKSGRWVAVAVVVALAGFLIVRAQVKASEHSKEEQALLAQTAQAAQAAGCTGVQTSADYHGAEDRQHVSQIPPLSSYPTQPPASGPHNATPLSSGVYSSPPPIDQAIHSLEHGAAEIWYSPSASGSELSRLQQFFRGQDHVLVAPYDYPGPGGQLATGKQLVLVAWHRIQSCDRLSLPVATTFVKLYHYDSSDPGAYRGAAPEPGYPI